MNRKKALLGATVLELIEVSSPAILIPLDSFPVSFSFLFHFHSKSTYVKVRRLYVQGKYQVCYPLSRGAEVPCSHFPRGIAELTEVVMVMGGIWNTVNLQLDKMTYQKDGTIQMIMDAEKDITIGLGPALVVPNVAGVRAEGGVGVRVITRRGGVEGKACPKLTLRSVCVCVCACVCVCIHLCVHTVSAVRFIPLCRRRRFEREKIAIMGTGELWASSPEPSASE